jgi:O-antigen ligase
VITRPIAAAAVLSTSSRWQTVARRLSLICTFAVALGFWMHPFAAIVGLIVATVAGFAATRSSFLFDTQRHTTLAIVLVYSISIAVPSMFLDPLATWVRMAGTPVLAFVSAAMLRPTAGEAIRLVKLLAAACAAAATLMYCQSGPFELSVSPIYLLTRSRADGYYLLGRFFEGATAIGGPLGFGFVSAVIAATLSRGIVRLCFLFCAILTLTMLILSVSRGGLVAALASVTTFAVTIPRRGARLKALAWLAGACLACAAIGLAALTVAISSIPSAAARYEIVTGGVGQDASMGERFLVWKHYLQVASSNAFGHGFTYIDSPSGLLGYSTHNELLGLWVAAGVFGVLSFLIFVVHWASCALSRTTSTASGSHSLGSVSMSLLVFFMFAGLVENYSVSSGSLLYVVHWFVAGVLLMAGASVGDRATSAEGSTFPSLH